MTKYPRGFQSDAENIAEEVRAEMGLSVFARLDPHDLAKHLDVLVYPLSELPQLVNLSERSLIGSAIQTLFDQGAAFSAVTIFVGLQRVIVHNDAHGVERQASNVCHELAHGLLLHPPAPALTEHGLRDFDTTIEDEAAYLGAALLIPGKAARGSVTRHMTIEQVAEQFGTSVEPARWRINTTARGKIRHYGTSL